MAVIVLDSIRDGYPKSIGDRITDGIKNNCSEYMIIDIAGLCKSKLCILRICMGNSYTYFNSIQNLNTELK